MPFLDPEELKPKLREVFENVVIPQIVKAKMEQTAVEFLFEQLCSEKLSWNKDSNGKLFFDKITSDILQQAKEIEKEQITAAYRVGKVEANLPPEKPTTGEQYYDQTYKSE